MPQNSDEILRTYMENVLKLQREREQNPLTDAELKQIAFEAGMSEDDIAYVERSFLDHMNRGEGFIRYENWDGAVSELEQAVALSPANVTALSALATASWSRARLSGNDRDRARAEEVARRALKLDSRNDTALRVLSAIEKGKHKRNSASSTLPEARGRATRMVMLMLAIALLGVGLSVFMVFSGSDTPEPLPMETQPPIEAPPAPPAPPAPKPPSDERLLKPVMKFGSEGIGPGMFTDARSIAVDGAGHIYVGEYGSGRIQVFDSLGAFITQWSIGTKKYLKSLTADRRGTVYAVHSGRIHRFEGLTGKPLGELRYGGGPGFTFASATADGGLVAAWDGHWRGGILVNVKSKDDIIRFGADGKVVRTIRTAISSASDELEMDAQVAADGLGNIYALGRMTSAVFRFSPEGKFANRFGGRGNQPGQFRFPQAIAVDGKGRVIIADNGLKVFDTDGRFIGEMDIRPFPSGIVVNDRNEVLIVGRTEVAKYRIGI